MELIPECFSNSAADDAIELCSAYGLELDPWQQYVLRGGLGENEDGIWSASRVGGSVPRQSGKTAIFEARELSGLLLFGERLLVHSAHLVPTADEAFERIKSYFYNYDDLSKLVLRIREASGSKAIEMKSGQRLRFMARSGGQGRGFSPDVLLIDEAQELSEETWSDILPAMSARPNPQAWLFGTPPSETNNGEVFRKIRDSGLAGQDPRLSWMEWSADRDADFDDPAVWAQANPAMGIRVPQSAIEDERNSMSDVKFGRERLGIWDSTGTARVISAESWEALGRADLRDGGGEMAIAIDVSPDRDTTTLCSVQMSSEGVPYIEAKDTVNGPPEWVVDRVKTACEKFNVRAVVLDSAGPAGSLIDPLRAAKVEPTIVGAAQVKRACGAFYDAVRTKGFRHRNQAHLNSAVAAGRKRKLEDAWAWSRKDPESDITPLVAATLALWGFTAPDVKKPLRKAGGAMFI